MILPFKEAVMKNTKQNYELYFVSVYNIFEYASSSGSDLQEIIISSLDSCYILLSTYREKQNHTSHLVEHTGLLFCKVVYSGCDVPSEML
jgi:hypothetical protein